MKNSKEIVSILALLLTFLGILFIKGPEFLFSQKIAILHEQTELIRKIRGVQQDATGSFGTFIELLEQVNSKARQGQLGQIILINDIREMLKEHFDDPGPEMTSIYEQEAQKLVAQYNGHISSVLVIHDREKVYHNLTAGMRMIGKISEQIDLNQTDNPIVMIGDGGRKTRAGLRTLAYGYAGLMSMPGSHTLREVVFSVAITVLNQLPDKGKDFVAWMASDLFLFPGNINFNGKSLSSVPEDTGFIISDYSKTELFTEVELEELTSLIRKIGDGEDDKTRWQSIMENQDKYHLMEEALLSPAFETMRTKIERKGLMGAGVFTVDGEGRVNWYREEPKDIVELVKQAYLNKGAIFINTFLLFINKGLAERLYQGLNYPSKDFGTLANLPVSIFEAVCQSQTVSDEAEWIRLWDKLGFKDRGISSEDWLNLKRVIDEIFTQQDKKIYAIELDTENKRGSIERLDAGLRADVGILSKMDEVIGWIVDDNPIIRQKVRFALGIPVNKNIINSPSIEEMVRERRAIINDNVYLENVVVEGGGILVIEKGVVLQNVLLEIPAGERLIITQNSKIFESDLRGVKVEFKGPKGVIDRYFSYGEENLVINEDEWITSLRIKNSMGEYEIITARQDINLALEELAGYSFLEAQENIDYDWSYQKAEMVKRIVQQFKDSQQTLIVPLDLQEYAVRRLRYGKIDKSILTMDEFLQAHRGESIPLITGATGFIGSHLADALLEGNQEVLAFTRSRNQETIKKIKHNLGKDGFYCVEISDYFKEENIKNLEQIIKQTPIIYHLAAHATGSPVIEDMEELIEFFTANSLLTALITTFAQRHNKKVVFASSALIYGGVKNKEIPINEDTPLPISKETAQWIKDTAGAFQEYIIEFIEGRAKKTPVAFVKEHLLQLGETKEEIESKLPEGIYFVSKLIGEEFVKQLSPGHGIILRYSFVYGPRIREDQMFAIVINRFLNQQPVWAFKDNRNYIYVEDAAQATVTAGELEFDNNEIFIISSPEGRISQIDLIPKIKSLIPGAEGVPIEVQQRGVIEPPFDVTRAQELLGLKATPLDIALEATVNWFLGNRESESTDSVQNFQFNEKLVESLRKPREQTTRRVRQIDLPQSPPELAQWVFAKYNLGQIKEIEIIEEGRGLHERPLLVETTKGKYILSLTTREIDELRGVIEYKNFMIKHGIPLQKIMMHKEEREIFEDRFFVTIDGKNYLVYEYVEGEIIKPEDERSKLTPSRVKNATILLGKMDRLGSEFQTRYKLPKGIASWEIDLVNEIDELEKIKGELEEGPVDLNSRGARLFLDNYEFIISQIEKLARNLSSSEYGRLRQLYSSAIYGDFSRYNLVFEGDEVKKIIDDEHVSEDFKLWDLVNWLISAREDYGSFNLSELGPIIEIHQYYDKFSSEESESIPELARAALLGRILFITDINMITLGIDIEEYDLSSLPDSLKVIGLINSNDIVYKFFYDCITALHELDQQDWEDFLK